MESTTVYLFVGWLVTFITLAVYLAAMVRRGRRLSRQLPAEARRWM